MIISSEMLDSLITVVNGAVIGLQIGLALQRRSTYKHFHLVKRLSNETEDLRLKERLQAIENEIFEFEKSNNHD